MSSSSRSSIIVVVASALVIIAALIGQCQCQGGDKPPLRVGFYKDTCDADVEEIVSDVVRKWFIFKPTITATLLRLQFSDCFVNGCDASILLGGSNSEQTAEQNAGLQDYDQLIGESKLELERVCPGVVSCADIIAMATRDAVALSSGGVRYEVETGRRDGTVSLASNVDLPSPSISVSDSIEAFALKGLNVTDMVYLLGGHTVGFTNCSRFEDRLYDFDNTGEADPTMDTLLLITLRLACPRGSLRSTVTLDQNPLSLQFVDNSYYRQILLNRGVLKIDQELGLDPRTKPIVKAIADGFDFPQKFGQAMIKMGSVQVLTGDQGQIRTFCHIVR